MPKSEDVPIEFEVSAFVNYLRDLTEENNANQYMEYLLMRIRTMLADTSVMSTL